MIDFCIVTIPQEQWRLFFVYTAGIEKAAQCGRKIFWEKELSGLWMRHGVTKTMRKALCKKERIERAFMLWIAIPHLYIV